MVTRRQVVKERHSVLLVLHVLMYCLWCCVMRGAPISTPTWITIIQDD